MLCRSSGLNPDKLRVMARRRDIGFKLLNKAFYFNAFSGCGGTI
jgi:hypothetical protein